MKHVKEQLKQVHEDELQRLTAENDRLSSELSKLSQKLQELVTHVAKQQEKDTACLPWVQHILNGNHENEMKSLKEEVERLKNYCQEQQKQIREQCETVRILERTNKQLEIDNETLAFKLSESLAQFDELEDQLRREATRVRLLSAGESLYNKIASKESNAKNINKMLDNRPNTQDPAFGDQVKQLKEESSTLKEQLESVQQQLEIMSMKYQQHKERYREKIYRLRSLVFPGEHEWVKDNKFEGKSEEQLKEEQLRNKAVIEREKEIAKFQRDKKEREDLAKKNFKNWVLLYYRKLLATLYEMMHMVVNSAHMTHWKSELPTCFQTNQVANSDFFILWSVMFVPRCYLQYYPVTRVCFGCICYFTNITKFLKGNCGILSSCSVWKFPCVLSSFYGGRVV
ncbi:UNVERIFIED_CONTAM: hypothetical protein NCL1_19400 [Trichonephila clavipes]